MDFLDRLSEFGEDLSNLDNTLLAISAELVADLKRTAPEDTGKLKRSIQAFVQDNSLQIEMLNYGFFQNYGVAGDGGNEFGVRDVQAGAGERPRSGTKYKFGTRQAPLPAYGLKSGQNSTGPWFNIEEMADRITREIANRIEL